MDLLVINQSKKMSAPPKCSDLIGRSTYNLKFCTESLGGSVDKRKADSMLKKFTIEQFTKELAADSPVPGGGSAAALAAATAAGLISMVASLTIGKSGYEEHWEEMERIRDEMEEARHFFLDAMDKDAGSYAKVIDCFKMPKNTEEEKVCRTEAIQNALYEAAVVPLRVAEKAASLFEYAGIVIEKGNKNAASDGAVAALMARAATRGALFNVRINAESLKDPQKKSEILKRAEELEKEADGAERKALEQLTL